MEERRAATSPKDMDMMPKRSHLSREESTMRISKPGALLLVALCLALAACSASKVRATTPPIGELRDGVFEGRAFHFPVKVRVSVTILAGRIQGIELLQHFNGRGKAAEAIIPVIEKRQSLDVDVISGATHSSLTILAAVEDALGKARRP